MTLSTDILIPLITPLSMLETRRKTMRVAIEAYARDPEHNIDAFHAAFSRMSEITDPIEKTIAAELAVVLPAVSAKGLPQPAECAGSVIFDEVWGDICETGWDSLAEYRKEQTCEALAKTYVGAIAQLCTTSTDEEAAAALIEWIEAGTCPLTMGGDDYFKNFADGTQAYLAMTNWAPQLLARDDDGLTMPLTRQPDGMAFHQLIDFPSGKLLVSDSVRVDAVIQALDDLIKKSGISINYGHHRLARTSLSASMLNILDIAMGDDGPSMVQDPDSNILFAGDSDETFKTVASVCHDYWGTRIVDREVAIALSIKGGLSRDEAEAEIAAWLESSSYANEIKVPAGTYNLYWDDDRETLDKMLREGGASAPADTRFVLSQEPIPALEADTRLRRLRQVTAEQGEEALAAG